MPRGPERVAGNCRKFAPQALALLNDTFIRDRAADFAARLLAASNGSWERAIEQGFWLALSRAPTDGEQFDSHQFVADQIHRRAARNLSAPSAEIERQALSDFCQALFSLNEFIYVD